MALKNASNIFEYATRNKLRFEFRGSLSVEELWDLSVNDLDSIYKKLNKKIREREDEGLLSSKSDIDEKLEIKISIIKHIFEVKMEEKERNERAVERKAKRQEILAIKEARGKEALKNATDEELDKMLDELRDEE